MKYFVTFLFIALLCQNSAEAQTPTYAGVPGPENVLVVYNSQHQISIDVKNYYQLKRGIPESNICPLDSLLPREILNYNGEDHVIKIVQSGDICSSLLDCSSGWIITHPLKIERAAHSILI